MKSIKKELLFAIAGVSILLGSVSAQDAQPPAQGKALLPRNCTRSKFAHRASWRFPAVQ